MRASATLKQMLVVGIAGLGLAACGGDMDDLDSYINEIKARDGGRIEPLPEITPYESFTYIADVEGVRSPFPAGSAADGRWCQWSAPGRRAQPRVPRDIPAGFVGDGRHTEYRWHFIRIGADRGRTDSPRCPW